MPRRKKNAEGELHKPLLRIERIVYEKASFRLRKDVLQNIAEYVLYVKEMTGDEPSPDELVDRGMQRLFDADRGFRQWLQRKAEPVEISARADKANEALRPKNATAASLPIAKDLSD